MVQENELRSYLNGLETPISFDNAQKFIVLVPDLVINRLFQMEDNSRAVELPQLIKFGQTILRNFF